MSGKSETVSQNVHHYVTQVITIESAVARRLREETGTLPQGGMLTTPDQGAFLALLVRLTNAKRILEIGTFTGYGTLAMASALGEGGTITACDVSTQWTDIARRYWQEAGVDRHINLRIAPANETLKTLIAQNQPPSFDFVFIDADKTGYDSYYELSLKLLRSGGLIAFDNMLWGGAVAGGIDHSPDTVALRALNLKIRDDNRVECCLLTVADGMMLVRKR